MKKIKLLSMMVLVVMAPPIMVACGGDDADDKGGHVIDGVNVNSGKKLVRLNMEVDINSYGDDKGTYDLRMSYDSKGRLSKIIIKDVQVYDYNTNETTKNDYVLANIDYDLRVVDMAVYNSKFFFMLNDKGYISQIGSCHCQYDNDGYLIGVDNVKEIWNIVYDSNDIIMSSVDNLTSGKMKIYYYYYGEDTSKGELVFTMNDSNNSNLHWDIYNNGIYSVISFIAYQSGLFGKISKHCSALPNKNSASFAKTNGTKSRGVHCTFEFE